MEVSKYPLLVRQTCITYRLYASSRLDILLTRGSDGKVHFDMDKYKVFDEELRHIVDAANTIKGVRDDMLDFVMERLESQSESVEVVYNAVLNVLAQMTIAVCDNEMDAIKDTAETVRVAIIDYCEQNKEESSGTIH